MISDAYRALTPSGAKPVSRLGASRVDHGEGDLREALIAYWTVEGCTQRAANLRMGWPLDYLDRRIAKAVAAFNGAKA